MARADSGLRRDDVTGEARTAQFRWPGMTLGGGAHRTLHTVTLAEAGACACLRWSECEVARADPGLRRDDVKGRQGPRKSRSRATRWSGNPRPRAAWQASLVTERNRRNARSPNPRDAIAAARPLRSGRRRRSRPAPARAHAAPAALAARDRRRKRGRTRPRGGPPAASFARRAAARPCRSLELRSRPPCPAACGLPGRARGVRSHRSTRPRMRRQSFSRRVPRPIFFARSERARA